MLLAKNTAEMESALTSKGEGSVLVDTFSPSSSDLQKNKQIPGISYVLILKSKTKKNTTKFQFDCVLCNLEEELFDGVKMRIHVRSRKHLMNVLELDDNTMFKNYKNDTALTDAELFQKVCNCQSGSQTRSVATDDTFESEREMLKTKILQLREACNRISASENLLNSDSDKKMDIKLEKLNSNIGTSPKKSNDVMVNNIQSFIEELGKKQNERHPSKIIFISDGRNEDLTPDKFGGGVQVVKSMKMNLGNVSQNLEKFKLLGKGSVFIVLCGVYSLVSCKVVDDCKKMKCQKQLVKYTINSEISDGTLISKALTLHSYILNKTTNDKVMFSDIVPLNFFKDAVRKCDNNHILENNISDEEYTKYLKILDEYNTFVEDHTRTMGFKNWRLLTNSFPLTDLVTLPLKTTYDYNKVDNQQALSYIVQKSKELLNSLKQVGDEHTVNGIKKFEDSDESKSPKVSKTVISIPIKPSIQARLLSSSKQLQDGKTSVTQVTSDNAEIKSQEEQKDKKSYDEFISRIETIASKQKDRQPSKILFAVDSKYQHLSLKINEFKDSVKIRKVSSFDNATASIKNVGNDYMIIALFGGYTLVSSIDVNICKIKKCLKPLKKHRISIELTIRSMIDKALNLHEYVLTSTQNDKVMFTELTPLVSPGSSESRCDNDHFVTENIPLGVYRTYLSIIDEYNEFVRYHSQIMGYKTWSLIKNSYPTRDNTKFSMQDKYDYKKIDYGHLSEYITNCTRELFLTLQQQNFVSFEATSTEFTEDTEMEVQLQELKDPIKKRIFSVAESFVPIQKNRNPCQIVLITDNETLSLKTEEFGRSVKTIKISNLNFANAFEILKKQDALDKGSVIILMCGISSLIKKDIVNVCKEKKCGNPLIKYSVIPNVTSSVIISKALALQKNILNKTSNDQVMFCNLLPVDISGDDTKECDSDHSHKNIIHKDIVAIYEKAIAEYNEFVDEHCQLFGFKNILFHKSFLSKNENTGSSFYENIDMQLLSDSILTSIRELLNSLKQNEPQPNADQKSSQEYSESICELPLESAIVSSESSVVKHTEKQIQEPSQQTRSSYEEFKSQIEDLALKQKDRHPSKVILALDVSYKQCNLKSNEFGDNVTLKNVFSFETAVRNSMKNFLGNDSMIVALFGGYSVANPIVIDICRIMKCSRPIRRHIIDTKLTVHSLIKNALNVHEYVVQNTENDKVMFTELTPLLSHGKHRKVCDKRHSAFENVSLNIYTKYLKIIDDYNEFVNYHSQVMGYKNWNIAKNFYPSRGSTSFSSSYNYNYRNIDRKLVSEYIISSVAEVLQTLNQQKQEASGTLEEQKQEKSTDVLPQVQESQKDDSLKDLSSNDIEKNKLEAVKRSMRVDAVLSGALKLVPIQKNRYPSQIVFVTDHETLALKTDKFGDYVKVAKFLHINIESTFQTLKKRNLLGKGSIIVLMCGIQSLIRVSTVEDCKKMKCPNSLLSYSIIPAMTGYSLVTKAIALQERILNETSNDQVMFCELIPVNISGSDTKVCGNNHTWKKVIHKDIYAAYPKAIGEYNEFVAKHCQMFGFKNFCLYEKVFLNRSNNLMQSVLEDIDVDLLSRTVCTGITELLEDMKEQMKNQPELIPSNSTGGESLTKRFRATEALLPQTSTISSTLSNEHYSEVTVATSVPEKVFDEILLITSAKNTKKREFLRQSKVQVVVAHSFSSKEVILLIKRAMNFHAGRTLYLLDTDIMGLAHYEDYISCTNSDSLCCPPLPVLVPDEEILAKYICVIDDAQRSLQSLIAEANSILSNGSAFCILPPSPPVVLDLNSVSDHFLFHNIELGQMDTEVYFATYKSINNFKTSFTRYSKALLSVLLSEVSKFGISDGAFRNYTNTTAHWDYHINAVTYHTFVKSSINIVGSRYSMWLNAVNVFVSDCLGLHPSEVSKWKLREPVVNSSVIEQCIGNDQSADNITNLTNKMLSDPSMPDDRSGFYDHIVFIGFCPKQIGLFPREDWILEKISVVTVKTQFNWNDVKQKLNSIKALGSFKSILFVLIGSIKLLANELNVSYCIKMKCRETLTYLNSGSLPVDRLVYNSMKTIYDLTSKIERYFMGRSDVVLVPLPTLCTKVSKYKHELLHKSSGEAENPYIVLGEKARWDEAADKFKSVWEKEMYQQFSKAKESMQYFMPNLDPFLDTMSFVYWTELDEESTNFGVKEIQKYRQFLKNFISVASPSMKLKNSQTSYSESLNFSDTRKNTRNKSITNTKDYSQTLPISLKRPEYEGPNSGSKKGDYSISSHHKSNKADKMSLPEPSISESLDTTKIVKTSNKISFEYVYIVGKKELSSLLNIKSKNVEFIHFEQEKFIESEIPTLTKNLGKYKNNSVCLLVSNILSLASETAVSPSCKQFGCETPISVMSLNIGEHIDETTTHSYVLNKIMNLMSFVSRLSLYLPVIIMPFFPASIFCDDGFFSINHKISHFIKNTDSYVAHGRKETWDCFERLTSDMWTSIIRSNNEKYFSKEEIEMFVAKSCKNLIFEENVNKLTSSCSEISSWKYMLEIVLKILINDSYGKGIESFPRNLPENSHGNNSGAARVESFGTAREQSEVLAPLKVKILHLLIVVWNCSSKEEGTIINAFKNADPHCDVHTYEDHYQFGVSARDAEEVYDIIRFLKSVDCNIRVSVIGENERFVVKYKTQMCDGSCQGNQKCCSFYHNQDDKRRIPYTGNTMLYKNVQCSYRVASKGCIHGDKCSYSHTNYEVDYHPLNYQSSVCPYKEIPLCVNQPWCNFSHKYTPEMFYNKDWEHLVGYGPESSLKFIIGAIRGFRKPSSMRRRKKAILLSSSIKFLNVVKSVILSLLKEIHVKVIIAGETTLDADNYDVILGTPSHIANYNWDLITRDDVRSLVVDDVLTLLNDSDSEFLFSIIDQYKNNATINKVYVCEMYDANAVEVLSEILETPLKEAKLSDYSSIKANSTNFKASEIQSKDLTSSETFETRHSGSREEIKKRSHIRSKRSRSHSPSHSRNKKQRSSSPRGSYLNTKSSETKTVSRPKRKSRSRDRSRSRSEKRKFSFGYQRRASRSRSRNRRFDSRTQDRKFRSRRSRSASNRSRSKSLPKSQQQASVHDSNQSASLQRPPASSASYFAVSHQQQSLQNYSGEVPQPLPASSTSYFAGSHKQQSVQNYSGEVPQLLPASSTSYFAGSHKRQSSQNYSGEVRQPLPASSTSYFAGSHKQQSLQNYSGGVPQPLPPSSTSYFAGSHKQQSSQNYSGEVPQPLPASSTSYFAGSYKQQSSQNYSGEVSQPLPASSTSYFAGSHKQQSWQNYSGEVVPQEFSVEGTISLLEQISSKIGMLGPAISEIAKVARENGVNSKETLYIFADEETVTLLQLVLDKLKILSKSGSLSDVSLLTKATDWIIKLMDYATNPPQMDADLNLKAIAAASMHKEPSYTLDLIRNAYVYVKKHEPTKEGLNEIYFKVCSLHFEMAVKDGK